MTNSTPAYVVSLIVAGVTPRVLEKAIENGESIRDIAFLHFVTARNVREVAHRWGLLTEDRRK